MKKFVIMTICLLGLLTIGISAPMVVSADSGWDNSYSGGSSGGGYSHYGRDSDGELSLLEVVVFLSAIVYMICRISISEKAEKLEQQGKTGWPVTTIKILKKIEKIVLVLVGIAVIGGVIFSVYVITDLVIKYPQESLQMFWIFLGIVALSIVALFIKGKVDRLSNIIEEYFNYRKQVKEKKKKNKVDSRYNTKNIKHEVYKNFVDVQKAWMDFDFPSLEELCGQELFESYKSDLEVLKKNKNKNIMKKFKYRNCFIYNISKEKDDTIIKALLYVSFKDYVINETTGKIVKGDNHQVFDNIYDLHFVRNNEVSIKCPSCGANVKGTVCDHCHTIIENYDRGLLLVNKRLIK